MKREGKSKRTSDTNLFPLSPSLLPRAAYGFALAMNMITILPFFKVHDFFKGINGYAVMFYPLVGALLGGILYSVYLLLTPYFPAEHVKMILLGLWVVMSGALHLDGFADTVDGLYVPKERARAVMKDPHVGGMGMLFSVLFLLLKASALWFLDAIYLLPVVLMLARYNAVLAIYLFPYIPQEGMGSLAKEEFTYRQLFWATIVVLIFTLLMPKGWLLLIASAVVLWGVKLLAMKRFGGFSGDLYGFLIELSELILLNILLFGVLS
ncbi:MAG: adenosylcobinamide-GDP ribazoletransferase [Campylobacterota bacterium]|nr:adenosylcobinamide-GDP ribazoletransferase [Campylobacterota bacterium]